MHQFYMSPCLFSRESWTAFLTSKNRSWQLARLSETNDTFTTRVSVSRWWILVNRYYTCISYHACSLLSNLLPLVPAHLSKQLNVMDSIMELIICWLACCWACDIIAAFCSGVRFWSAAEADAASMIVCVCVCVYWLTVYSRGIVRREFCCYETIEKMDAVNVCTGLVMKANVDVAEVRLGPCILYGMIKPCRDG